MFIYSMTNTAWCGVWSGMEKQEEMKMYETWKKLFSSLAKITVGQDEIDGNYAMFPDDWRDSLFNPINFPMEEEDRRRVRKLYTPDLKSWRQLQEILDKSRLELVGPLAGMKYLLKHGNPPPKKELWVICRPGIIENKEDWHKEEDQLGLPCVGTFVVGMNDYMRWYGPSLSIWSLRPQRMDEILLYSSCSQLVWLTVRKRGAKKG